MLPAPFPEYLPAGQLFALAPTLLLLLFSFHLSKAALAEDMLVVQNQRRWKENLSILSLLGFR